MKLYRLKPPVFEARRFNGKPDILTNGLFEWIGNSAKVERVDAKSITVSVKHHGLRRELVPGEWIVRDKAFGGTNYLSDEDFRRDFEDIERSHSK